MTTVRTAEMPSREVVENTDDVCWICLDGHSEAHPLVHPCKCLTRPSHPNCLARWNLQSAGKSEESRCRFCSAALPDWKDSLTPNNTRSVSPVMAIKFEGKTYKLKVKPGPDGLKEFQDQVRELLGFSITEDFDVTFECQIPQTGEKMKLNGLSSYGAATHCAAITAAQREVIKAPRNRPSRARSELASTSGTPSRHHRASVDDSAASTSGISTSQLPHRRSRSVAEYRPTLVLPPPSMPVSSSAPNTPTPTVPSPGRAAAAPPAIERAGTSSFSRFFGLARGYQAARKTLTKLFASFELGPK